MLICGFLVARTARGDANCTANPKVALAHALEEHVEIETLVGCSERETVLVVGQEVTNHLLVAMVFNGVVAVSDFSITVNILIFHVARTEFKVVALVFTLRCDARFQFPVAVEVVSLEQAVGFVTSYLA